MILCTCTDRGTTNFSEKKIVPFSICPTKTPHGLHWDQTLTPRWEAGDQAPQPAQNYYHILVAKSTQCYLHLLKKRSKNITPNVTLYNNNNNNNNNNNHNNNINNGQIEPSQKHSDNTLAPYLKKFKVVQKTAILQAAHNIQKVLM
jgi:hypothetical protein